MTNDTAMNEVLEIVQFLKDNAASKNDLTGLVTKQDLIALESRMDHKLETEVQSIRAEIAQTRSDIMTQIDSFIQLYQKLDQELTALRGKHDRLEEMFMKMARHLQLDVSKL